MSYKTNIFPGDYKRTPGDDNEIEQKIKEYTCVSYWKKWRTIVNLYPAILPKDIHTLISQYLYSFRVELCKLE